MLHFGAILELNLVSQSRFCAASMPNRLATPQLQVLPLARPVTANKMVWPPMAYLKSIYPNLVPPAIAVVFALLMLTIFAVWRAAKLCCCSTARRHLKHGPEAVKLLTGRSAWLLKAVVVATALGGVAGDVHWLCCLLFHRCHPPVSLPPKHHLGCSHPFQLFLKAERTDWQCMTHSWLTMVSAH